MARWKYKTAVVTVDENSVTVRGLTAGERLKFAEASKKEKAVKSGAAEATTGEDLGVSRLIAKCGVIDPPLTDEDLESMPGDMLGVVVTKILELSGVTDDSEKKEPDAVH